MGQAPRVNAHNIRFAEVGLQNRLSGGSLVGAIGYAATRLERAGASDVRGHADGGRYGRLLFPKDTIFMRHTAQCFQITLETHVLTSTY
jgi:hypothetical protein